MKLMLRKVSLARRLFQVIGWEAVDAGLITAAAVLSALSWASLGIYFIKDYLFTKKPTSMSGSPSFGLTTSTKSLSWRRRRMDRAKLLLAGLSCCCIFHNSSS